MLCNMLRCSPFARELTDGKYPLALRVFSATAKRKNAIAASCPAYIQGNLVNRRIKRPCLLSSHARTGLAALISKVAGGNQTCQWFAQIDTGCAYPPHLQWLVGCVPGSSGTTVYRERSYLDCVRGRNLIEVQRRFVTLSLGAPAARYRPPPRVATALGRAANLQVRMVPLHPIRRIWSPRSSCHASKRFYDRHHTPFQFAKG